MNPSESQLPHTGNQQFVFFFSGLRMVLLICFWRVPFYGFRGKPKGISLILLLFLFAAAPKKDTQMVSCWFPFQPTPKGSTLEMQITPKKGCTIAPMKPGSGHLVALHLTELSSTYQVAPACHRSPPPAARRQSASPTLGSAPRTTARGHRVGQNDRRNIYIYIYIVYCIYIYIMCV